MLMYVHTCTYILINENACLYTHICICTHKHIDMHIHTHRHKYPWLYTHAHRYWCEYAHGPTYVYIDMHLCSLNIFNKRYIYILNFWFFNT